MDVPIVFEYNSSVTSISWTTPNQRNGPPPNYTLWRSAPAFSSPPVAVENEIHFPGASYFEFQRSTIPQEVYFTDVFLLFQSCAVGLFGILFFGFF